MLDLPTLYYGAVVNPVNLTSFAALPRCLLAVSPDGDIAWLVEDVEESALQETMAANGCESADVVALKDGEFLLPGFIDTHTHAPQVPNIGSGQQYELLDWLDNVTFPMEARFADIGFARRAYQHVIRRYIDCGTTTCCYYGTLHLEATKVLADIIHSEGQRAFVGKCNMNQNCPPTYIEPSVESSLADTKSIIAHIQGLPAPATYSPTHSLVHPIITPRFAISCTSPLLHGLGAIAASDRTLRIQTHISENPAEVAFTRKLFPESKTYAGVYDDHGLLRDNTVLAHAIHLEDEEMRLIALRKAGISHCPTSNFNLRSGLARVGEMLDRGIKVSLGTDVSGGFSPSILTAIQHASMCSKAVATQHTQPLNGTRFSNRQLPVATLLYLATLGGAEVCALEGRIGSFKPGKAFDALLVSVRSDAGNPGLWGSDLDDGLSIQRADIVKARLEGKLEQFLFCGDDRNIRRVFVQGRWVGGAEPRR